MAYLLSFRERVETDKRSKSFGEGRGGGGGFVNVREREKLGAPQNSTTSCERERGKNRTQWSFKGGSGTRNAISGKVMDGRSFSFGKELTVIEERGKVSVGKLEGRASKGY